MRSPAIVLAASILALAASSAVGQDASADSGLEGTSAGSPATALDLYPLDEAGETPPDPILPPEDGETPLAPALRPTLGAVAPLRTVVRPVERTSVAVLPVTGAIPLPSDPEADARAAFEPLGLRIGGFDIFTTSRSAIGYAADSGTYWRTEGEYAARSNWERHSLGLILRGGILDYRRSGQRLEPSADVRLEGALDLTEVDRIGISSGYSWSQEDSDSAELQGGAAASNIHVLSGSLGYERTAGMVGLALRGAVDHSIYTRSGDRTNTAYSLSLRSTLDSGGMVRPFSEAGIFARRYVNEIDGSGYRRDSIGGELKGGLVFDTGLTVGEIAVGYAIEEPEDGRLSSIRGVLAEASLVWTPTRLTTVTLTADTAFAPTQLTGASGSIDRTFGLSLAHALRPNITVDTGLSYGFQNYVGIDRQVHTMTARVGGTWRINRAVELGIAASHEITDSSAAGDDGEETRVEAAVTFRR